MARSNRSAPPTRTQEPARPLAGPLHVAVLGPWILLSEPHTQMESNKSSGAGTGGKSKRSGSTSKRKPEDPMLGEFGLGRSHPKQTCCFFSTVI